MKNFSSALIVLFMLFTTSLYSQNDVEVRDTIYTITKKTFHIPQMGGRVFDNVFSWNSYTAEVLDTLMNKIKDCDTIYRYRTDEQLAEYARKSRRGLFDWLVAETSLDEKGQFYVRMSVDIRGENNSKFQKDYYYRIISDYPTMAAPIYLDDVSEILLKEKETFSFATVEFDDYSKYSYKIYVNNNEETSASGSVVSLDEILSNSDNVGATIRVEGLYDGETFNYYSTDKSKVSESVWEFTLIPPSMASLQQYSGWPSQENYEKEPEKYAEAPLSLYSGSSLVFQYAYIYETRGGYVWENVRATGVSVTIDNEELEYEHIFQSTAFWGYIYLTIDRASLDKLRSKYEDAYLDEMPEMTVTIELTTQYGHTNQWEYKSKVLF